MNSALHGTGEFSVEDLCHSEEIPHPGTDRMKNQIESAFWNDLNTVRSSYCLEHLLLDRKYRDYIMKYIEVIHSVDSCNGKSILAFKFPKESEIYCVTIPNDDNCTLLPRQVAANLIRHLKRDNFLVFNKKEYARGAVAVDIDVFDICLFLLIHARPPSQNCLSVS